MVANLLLMRSVRSIRAYNKHSPPSSILGSVSVNLKSCLILTHHYIKASPFNLPTSIPGSTPQQKKAVLAQKLLLHILLHRHRHRRLRTHRQGQETCHSIYITPVKHHTDQKMRLQILVSTILLFMGMGIVSGRGILLARDSDDVESCDDLCTDYWNCVNVDSWSGSQCNPPVECDC